MGMALLELITFFTTLGGAHVTEWLIILRVAGSVLLALAYMKFVNNLKQINDE
jgi:hypothetical protein